MTDNLIDLLRDFDDATHDVAYSNSGTFEANLARWFEVIDEALALNRVIAELVQSVDVDGWYKECSDTQGSFIGSAKLIWPAGQKRLAMQVALMRAISSGKPDYGDVDNTFFGNVKYDDMVAELNQQIFSPMARDLRKHIERRYRSLSDIEKVAPASDRTVPVDHNSPDYAEAVAQLDRLEELLQQANDYSDMEDKERRIAEIGATKRLLSAARVSVDALLSVAYQTLEAIAKKFTELTIGKVAAGVLELLGKITGLW
jgi:hypothetical protein